MCSDEIYQRLKLYGNAYGPSFTGIRSLSVSTGLLEATVVIPNVAETMPAKYMQPHIIHPTTLDIVMHSSLPLASQYNGAGSIMPVYIKKLVLRTDMENTPGDTMNLKAQLCSTNSRTAEVNIKVLGDDGFPPSLSIYGLKLRTLGTRLPNGNAEGLNNGMCWDLVWGIDADFLSREDFTSLAPTNKSNEVMQEKIRMLNRAAKNYIKRCLDVITHGQIKVAAQHQLLFDWMTRQEARGGTLQATPPIATQDAWQSSEHGKCVEMQLVARTGLQLPSILSGNSNALDLVLQDDLLYRAYQDDSSTRCYGLMRQFVNHISFKKANMRVLEIGAGTGSATLPFLQAMKDAGYSPAEYCFTDISSGFFDRAADLLSNFPITYQRLDIEKDPILQDFEAQRYDVVLACNCLHATSRIRDTLWNVRALLKPDGRLVLIEVVNPQPYHHITFGTLAGYWKGHEDGRPDGPFMPVNRWGNALNEVFMEMQFSVNDNPLAPVSSLMVARPQETVGTFKAVKVRPVNDIQSQFAQSVCASLQSYGVETELMAFGDDFDNGPTISIILDDGKQPLLSEPSSNEFETLITILKHTSRIIWVSSSRETSSFRNPQKHLISGLVRTAHAENDSLRVITIDIQQNPDTAQSCLLKLLCECLRSFFSTRDTTSEREFIIRDGKVQVPRLLLSKKVAAWIECNRQSPKLESSTIFTQRESNVKALPSTDGLLSQPIVESRLRTDPSLVRSKVFNFGPDIGATFIIAGGLGDLGRRILVRLATHGARHVVTLSRRSPNS